MLCCGGNATVKRAEGRRVCSPTDGDGCSSSERVLAERAVLILYTHQARTGVSLND